MFQHLSMALIRTLIKLAKFTGHKGFEPDEKHLLGLSQVSSSKLKAKSAQNKVMHVKHVE
jgi:hypothetical protein